MLGGLPRDKRPVLLRTLVVRLGLEEPPWPSASWFFFRLHSRKAAKAMAARPSRMPSTIPAIAPLDNDLRGDSADAGESPLLITTGVVVTV
jgi:hypothetical protein